MYFYDKINFVTNTAVWSKLGIVDFGIYEMHILLEEDRTLYDITIMKYGKPYSVPELMDDDEFMIEMQTPWDIHRHIRKMYSITGFEPIFE